jgi:hypothetical protein
MATASAVVSIWRIARGVRTPPLGNLPRAMAVRKALMQRHEAATTSG